MSAVENVLLARQAIYNTDLEIVAYELLFRSFDDNFDPHRDGDAATSQVVVNAFTEIGIDKVTENKPAYVNFTRHWLMDPPELQSDHIVIEVLEHIELDDQLMQALQALARHGYRIALDDYADDGDWEPVLRLADVVKIDVLEYEREQLSRLVQRLKPYGVQLLAEKVETPTMYEFCRELGFDYFQGFFLFRPQEISGDAMPANRLAVVQLLSELQNPNADMGELEKLIARDPTLSYKILRIINSASYQMPEKVTSLHRAITLLGLQQLRRWASAIALSKLSDKPSALTYTAMVRARFCEQIGQYQSAPDPDRFFSVGLFSTLDALLDQPMSDILAQLPLVDSVNRAIGRYEGVPGRVLASIVAHEAGEFERIDWATLTDELGVTPRAFEDTYLESIAWASQICNPLMT